MADEILSSVDETIHAKARLGIMTILVSEGSADFRTLKERLGLTDGNLGAHLGALEGAGYIRVEKSFVDRKPRTRYAPSPRGSAAFTRYLDSLQALIRSVRPQG